MITQHPLKSFNPIQNDNEFYVLPYPIAEKLSPLLSTSRYSINGQAADILERGCNGFVQKPFSMIGLSQKIRKILDKE